MKRIKNEQADSLASRTGRSAKDLQVRHIPINKVIPDPRNAQTHGNPQVAFVGATSKRGRPFEPGNHFGRGRPKGSRNKRTLLGKEVIDRRGGAVVEKATDMAEQGNEHVIHDLLPYILQKPKDPPSKIEPEGKDDAAQELIVRFFPPPPRGGPDGNDGSPAAL